MKILYFSFLFKLIIHLTNYSLINSFVAGITNFSNTTYTKTVCAKNGSCYGDISRHTGLPKTIHVKGYYKRDGTYVREHYRSQLNEKQIVIKGYYKQDGTYIQGHSRKVGGTTITTSNDDNLYSDNNDKYSAFDSYKSEVKFVFISTLVQSILNHSHFIKVSDYESFIYNLVDNILRSIIIFTILTIFPFLKIPMIIMPLAEDYYADQFLFSLAKFLGNTMASYICEFIGSIIKQITKDKENNCALIVIPVFEAVMFYSLDEFFLFIK